jgi:hypothetical protein
MGTSAIQLHLGVGTLCMPQRGFYHHTVQVPLARDTSAQSLWNPSGIFKAFQEFFYKDPSPTI